MRHPRSHLPIHGLMSQLYCCHRKRMKADPATVVRTKWELEDYEVQCLEEQFGEGVLKSRTIGIDKGYSNEQLGEIPLDEESIVKSILAGANLNAIERNPLARQESVRGLLATLSAMGSLTPKHQALLEEIQGKFADGNAVVSSQERNHQAVAEVRLLRHLQSAAGTGRLRRSEETNCGVR